MQKKLYGYVSDGDPEDIGNMMVYVTLDELMNENNVDDNDHVFVWELVDQGHVKTNPAFISDKKKK